MDDDAGDWLSEAVNEPEPTPIEAPKLVATADNVTLEATTEVPVETTDEPQQEAAEYLDPDKLLLFRHWIRPKFLQYNYLYDYRHNYYDDVIDYLDKRQRGFSRDVPRAQTWAERALRTYSNKSKREEYFKKSADDLKLVTNTKLSGSFFRYHSRQYVYRRYFSVLA